MPKYVRGNSMGDILDKVMASGIDPNLENKLYLEQALEVFLGQKFDSGEFLEELLDLKDWTMAEQYLILDAVEPYEGQMVYSVDTPLVARIQAANERANKIESNCKEDFILE